MEALLNSFLLVMLGEMGDKTQLLAFSLAARFKRPWAVMAGVLVATVLNHTLASSLGSWISLHVPEHWMTGILAATFIGFGLWTLVPDKHEESKEYPARSAFVTTAVLFFLAEMGDKTQLATIALAAKYRVIGLVTVGTTLGMLVSDGLAVFVGEKLAEKISMKKVRWVAAGLFFVLGAFAAAAFFGVRIG